MIPLRSSQSHPQNPYIKRLSLYLWAWYGSPIYPERTELERAIRSEFRWKDFSGIDYQLEDYPDVCMCGKIFPGSRRLRLWCHSCNGSPRLPWIQNEIPAPAIEIALARGVYYERIRASRSRESR